MRSATPVSIGIRVSLATLKATWGFGGYPQEIKTIVKGNNESAVKVHSSWAITIHLELINCSN